MTAISHYPAHLPVAGLCVVGTRRKYKYATEDDALQALASARAAQNERRTKRVERRVYLCPWGSDNHWHLTSQAARS